MITNNPYNNFDEFILRTPLLPFNFMFNLVNDNNLSHEYLKELFNIPIINESIFLASPSLYQEIKKWSPDEIVYEPRKKKKINKLINSFIRYLHRMSTRSTPFGLFAGTTIGKIANKTIIDLQSHNSFRCHTRLDMNYLCALALDLSRNPDICKQLKYYPNSSIYKIGNQVRYVEYKYYNSKRLHKLVAVDHSSYLSKLLIVARDGATVNDLIQILVTKDISIEDAEDFVNALIEYQVIESELSPSLIGEEFLDQILRVLSKLKQTKYINDTIHLLTNIKSKLASTVFSRGVNSIDTYEKIANDLISFNTKYDIKYLFQTDTILKSNQCLLSCEIIKDLKVGVSVLNKLCPKNPNNSLSKFKSTFVSRYEGESVPLLQALDNETGIGYVQDQSTDIAPLIDDIVLPDSHDSPITFEWKKVNSLLHEKYIDAIYNNKFEIELLENELIEFDDDWTDLPTTMSAMIQVFHNTPKYKHEIFINSISNSSAANLLGRFCHADEKIHDLVKMIISKDDLQEENVIYAEVTHLPESRTGNILLRPRLREYEIPYLAKSTVDKTHQIAADDLYISIIEDEVVLFSKELNKRVIPKLTTAHNYVHNSLPVYQFLCELQNQNKRGGLYFDWGPMAQQHFFLPRVRFKNIILCRASWIFNKKAIKSIFGQNNENAQIDAFKAYIKSKKIPDNVVLSDNDNELFLNLKNDLNIKILLNLIRNRSAFILTEFLFNEENLFVSGDQGYFVNELIIPLYKTNEL